MDQEDLWLDFGVSGLRSEVGMLAMSSGIAVRIL